MTLLLRKKRLPYAGTTIDPDRRIGMINQLLRSYGIENYSWTTMWSKNQVDLKFVVEDEKGRLVGVRLVAPPFMATHSSYNPKTGRTEKVEAPNWAQSLGLFHAYIKAKLEALAFGLRDVREEFLADLLVQRKDTGEETTVGRVYAEALEAGGFRAPALGPGRPLEREEERA